MKTKVFLTSGLIFFCVIFLATCDLFGTINQAVGGRVLRAAVRVNNGAAGRSVIGDDDKVEFYIRWLGYVGSPIPGSDNQLWQNINIIMHTGIYGMDGTKQYYQENNEGWFTHDFSFFEITNKPGDDEYNIASLRITAMRIGDREYPFPETSLYAYYGKDVHNFKDLLGDDLTQHFPDAYDPPITYDKTVLSILTVLEVDLTNILDCWEEDEEWGPSTVNHEYISEKNRTPDGFIHKLKQGKNPYEYITVIGTVN